MKSCNIEILAFFLCITINSVWAQSNFSIAGQHNPNDYYYDVNPDTSIYGIHNQNAQEYSIDIDRDGTQDFLITSCNCSGLGAGSPYTGISPLNNNEIAFSYIDFCSGARYMTAAFNLDDTVNVHPNWTKSASNLSYSTWMLGSSSCSAHTFSSQPLYIGVRLLSTTDTIYGWINVEGTSNSSITIKEFSCYHACVTQTSNNPQTICSDSNYSFHGHLYDTPGTYNDTLLNVYGCDSIVVTQLTLYLLPPPTITANGAILSSSSILGNQWYLNDTIINGATSHTYTVTQNGNYTVVVTHNNCTATSSIFNFSTLKIQTLDNKQLTIYPNPSNGLFTLQTKGKAVVVITNVLGQPVYETKTVEKQTQINLSAFAKGLYNVRLTSEEGEEVKRLVIE